MKKTNVQFKYHYSYFWLIFWAIFFFPIAFVLLLTGASFTLKDSIYSITYNGSRFWLGFWTLFFFPIAFILLFVNGFSLDVEKINCPNCTCLPK